MTATNLIAKLTAIKQFATRPAVLKSVISTCILLAVLWLVGCGVLYRIMHRPPEAFAGFMAKLPGPVPFLLFPFETLWLRARAGTLHPGDPAPDFSLSKLDKTAQVQLSAFAAQQRPVVLIFGSYT
jgi:Iodothyronine deiodinase